jgi:hypothetical protein
MKHPGHTYVGFVPAISERGMTETHAFRATVFASTPPPPTVRASFAWIPVKSSCPSPFPRLTGATGSPSSRRLHRGTHRHSKLRYLTAVQLIGELRRLLPLSDCRAAQHRCSGCGPHRAAAAGYAHAVP